MFAEIKNDLKNIQRIGNSVIIDNPIVVTEDKSVIMKVDRNINIENPVGIYNLSRFLAVLDVFGDDFESKVENNVIYLSKGKIKQKYETTAVELLEHTKIDPELFNKIKNTEPFITFNLNEDLLKYIKKIAGILGHKELVVDNGKLVITTLDANNNYIDENVVEVDIITDKRIVVDIDAINKIPELNYEVTVHQNAKGNIVMYLKAEEEPYDILIPISKTL